MPLPLPDLDDRRWADLVDEARALLPRYAPEWTDHNLSDPGITIIDLLAWAVEADLYRINRVTDALRRKLLDLVGLAPAPPVPARVVLAVGSRSGSVTRLPAGLVVTATQPGAEPLPFRLDAGLDITGLTVAAVQVDTGAAGGAAVADRTAALLAGPIDALGPDPAGGPDGPAVLLGLEPGQRADDPR